jgi:hypothetical protein
MSKRTIVLERRPFAGAAEHEMLTIEVAYEEGGTSIFSGDTSARGYFVRVRPERVENGLRSFTIFEGAKALVAPAKRFSDKALAAATPSPELVDKLVAKVVAERAARDARDAARRAHA